MDVLCPQDTAPGGAGQAAESRGGRLPRGTSPATCSAGDIVYWVVGCVGGGEPCWRRHCSLRIRKLPGSPEEEQCLVYPEATFAFFRNGCH